MSNRSLGTDDKEATIEIIEDNIVLDEERILDARTQYKNETTYDHTEVWKKLGV